MSPSSPSMVKETHAEAACERIGPAWPLNQAIAVNPWWLMTDQPIESVSAKITAYSGARMIVNRTYFKEQWEAGKIDESLLIQACREKAIDVSLIDLLDHLEQDDRAFQMPLVTHVLDSHRDLRHHIAWETEVTFQISQFCAAYFDQDQASWHLDTSEPPYAAWLETVAQERGIGLITGVKGLNLLFRSLPKDPDALLEKALLTLGVDSSQTTDYLHALLLSINGWASSCAYRKWQAGLKGTEDHTLYELLAIRLAWELILYEGGDVKDVPEHWKASMATWPRLVPLNKKTQSYDWIWQRALELSYQLPLAKELVSGGTSVSGTPEVQAAFCIDVRSEIFRRALEQVSDRVHTLGFAGFFGIPAAYRPLGTTLIRQQLPGLLPPGMLIEDTCPSSDGGWEKARQQRLIKKDIWRRFRAGASSGFSFVEVTGLLYGLNLFKEGIMKRHHHDAPGLPKNQVHALKPRMTVNMETGKPPTLEEKAAMALKILKGMSLTENLAPLVLLIGHTSASNNNPLAGGLDCGACCGQSGEVNARAVAAMLNDPDVRGVLNEQGFAIPDTTHFLPGIHNTVTDEVTIFDMDEASKEHLERIAIVQVWLEKAGDLARAERAPSLNIEDPKPPALKQAMQLRSHDWAETRPEWGLASNAGFIIAPRSMSRSINLKGRSFLHEYNWQNDEAFGVLESIMTAPMLVTHWINMQYYASTVDNFHYGCGNKVLHNVVGGNLGIFEGNGGDLRTGLSLQSLHDGEKWTHEPVRLSVFINAPKDAIAAIIERHEKIRDLIENEWIYLFQIEEEVGVARYIQGLWKDFFLSN